MTTDSLGDGRYVMRERLGAGGFATVYLARDVALDIDVAIKILDRRWADDADIRQRFVREARIQRSAAHPGIVAVHDIGETGDGCPFFVMDYADRGTLADRLADLAETGQPISATDVVVLLRELSDAIAAVHELGVAHRDLKPSNILVASARRPLREHDGPMLRRDERVQLSDFGLAKDLAAGSGLTIPGGTWGYMAPEQVSAAPVDRRADIYAASVLVSEIVTGQAPDPETRYSGGTALTGRPLPDDLPPQLRDALVRGLDLDPGRRHPDIVTWAAEITEAIEATQPWPVAAATTRPPGSRGTGPGRNGVPAGDDPTRLARRPATEETGSVGASGPRSGGAAHPSRPPRMGTTRLRLAAGVGAAAAMLVVVGAMVTLRGGGASLIVGPDRIAVGERATYRAAAPQGARWTWTDWAGTEIRDRDLFVQPFDPGTYEISLTVVEDGKAAKVERLRIRASVVPPTAAIEGPTSAAVGERVTFSARVGHTETFYWTNWDGERVEAPAFYVEPLSPGTFPFTLTAVGWDGTTVEAHHRLVVR